MHNNHFIIVSNHFIIVSDPLPIQVPNQLTELEFEIFNYGMCSTVCFKALIVLVICAFTTRIE